MEQMNYPLLFEPIYRKAIWGGEKLKTRLNRDLGFSATPYSESWEITDREDAMSIVVNGPLKGKSLRELMQSYRSLIIGESCRENRFPVMIRFVDANLRLSLQVHPDRKVSSEPKDEMWYIIDAEEHAQIYAGLKEEVTTEAFRSPEIEKYIDVTKSSAGDAYYISAGTVHAIGAGNFLLEICQNSDTTYRIHDWGRLEANGNPRKLHLEEALHCLKLSPEVIAPKIIKRSEKVGHNRRCSLENGNKFFNVDELKLSSFWTDHTNGQSCHILTSINKPITVTNFQSSAEVGVGRSCLVPATYGPYQIDIGREGTIVIKTVLAT